MALTYRMKFDGGALDELRRERKERSLSYETERRSLFYGIDRSVQQSPSVQRELSVQREPVPVNPPAVYEQTGEDLFASLLAKPSNRKALSHTEPKRRKFLLCGQCRRISCPASHYDDEAPGNPNIDSPRTTDRPSPNSLRAEYGVDVSP